jgi:2-oxoglutarate ferredoxin oxidoreductase subunit gamma
MNNAALNGTPPSAPPTLRDPVQVRFSGSGGQGLITAGVILAEAAMLDGKNAVQTQTYGPEARLGSSRSEVIISNATIAYPEVTVPDVLLCMSVEAARKYVPKVHADTLVILDSTNIGTDIASGGRVFRLPLTQTAVSTGSKVVANTIALAAMNEIAGVVSRESLRAAILARVPARFRELNEKAIAAGEEVAAAAARPVA